MMAGVKVPEEMRDLGEAVVFVCRGRCHWQLLETALPGTFRVIWQSMLKQEDQARHASGTRSQYKSNESRSQREQDSMVQ